MMRRLDGRIGRAVAALGVAAAALAAARPAAAQVGQAGGPPAPPAVGAGDNRAGVIVLVLKPYLAEELRLLTATAGPTPGQRRAIALAGGRKLKELAADPAGPPNPPKQIHDAVLAAARDQLPPERFARLQAELRARAEDRREATLMAVVEKMDRTLDLDADQRSKILDALRAAWDEATYPALSVTATWGNRYFLPNLPDGPIVAILNPAQKAAWVDAPKRDFQKIAADAGDKDGPNDGITVADPDLEAALAAEPKP